MLRRRVTYVAKAEYFDSWKTAWFFRAAGQIPMNRSGGDASQRALDTATEVLDAGRACSASIPRGPGPPTSGCTRATPGWRGCPAAATCPIIPVGDRDPGGPAAREQGDAAVPHRDHPLRAAGRLSPRRRPGHDGRVAPTGLPTGERGRDLDQAELRALTDALMAGIAELSGQEYVDRVREPQEGRPRATADPAIADSLSS